jgi:hypothetical protein
MVDVGSSTNLLKVISYSLSVAEKLVKPPEINEKEHPDKQTKC